MQSQRKLNLRVGTRINLFIFVVVVDKSISSVVTILHVFLTIQMYMYIQRPKMHSVILP